MSDNVEKKKRKSKTNYIFTYKKSRVYTDEEIEDAQQKFNKLLSNIYQKMLKDEYETS